MTQIEDRLRNYNAELDRLMRISRAAGGDIAGLLETVTKTLTQMLEIRRASVWMLDTQGERLVCHCLWEQGAEAVTAGFELNAQEYPSYFQAFQTSRVIAADDAAHDPRTSEFAEGYLDKLDIHSLLDAQIRDFSDLRGVVCCEQVGKPRHWREEDIAFVAAVAEYIGLAVELAQRQEAADALRESNERLGRALDTAEAANLAKTRFLATMSHELRTPLNGILGSTAILKNAAGPDAETQRWLDIIEGSGRSLLQVITAVLDMAAAEGGLLTVNTTEFDLSEAARDAAGEGARSHGAAALAVNLDPRISGPARVRADRTRAVQVIASFVDNAFKFAGAAPELHVCPSPRIDQWRLEVRDAGPGVPPDQAERVFDWFHQVDNSSRRAHGGIGLGLALSRELARVMQGAVGYQDRPGGGSVFWVDLPRA